mgnify:CR=1 FL=1
MFELWSLFTLGPILIMFTFVFAGFYLVLLVIVRTIRAIYEAIQDHRLTKGWDDDDEW